MSEHRSFSQLSTYEKCPYRYYLERVEKVWQKPAAWLPMGTAVHYACEKWELSGRHAPDVVIKAWFQESYWEATNKYLEETPNTAHWEASGPFKGPEDITRRFEVGQEHVIRYAEYYRKHRTEIPWVTPDGTPAIELPFDFELGGVPIRGFIDAVINVDGELIVRDTKSGRQPGDDKQLKIYALAIENIGGPTVALGDYFMTRTGKPTFPYDLLQVTKQEMTNRFIQLDLSIKAGEFPPNPGDECARCSVKLSCEYRVG